MAVQPPRGEGEAREQGPAFDGGFKVAIHVDMRRPPPMAQVPWPFALEAVFRAGCVLLKGSRNVAWESPSCTGKAREQLVSRADICRLLSRQPAP
jgi:hypothetical protein